MYSIVRSALEVYLKEKRIVTHGDMPFDPTEYINSKDAVFVTLYSGGKVIASSGRIACKKENTFYECVDNALLCLEDPRMSALTEVGDLEHIAIRTDRFTQANRRILGDISLLDPKKE
jgi:hypothetical protein